MQKTSTRMAPAASAAIEGNGGAVEHLTISPPNIRVAVIDIIGTAPLMQARFSEKAKGSMRDKHQAGSVAAKGKKREPRDFDADFHGAMHIAEDGWHGIPAAAFRNAMIDACRLAGFQMTRGKMSVFVQQDGIDADDGTPLVRLEAGEPEKSEMMVRNATGVADIRVRPMWRQWAATIRVQYDADQFTQADVSNLLLRAGIQVGVGEGRPFSKSSNGIGMGTFTLAGEE